MEQPNWSFQDDAIQACIFSLNEDLNKKIGLVIPTGGGKTRTALRFALKWLDKYEEGNIVWVVHRLNLRDQAHAELQEIITEDPLLVPENSPALLHKRIEFRMVSDLKERLEREDSPPVLVIVDEAHHAAAESYQSIFATPYPLNALFLTATPNRTDDLPLGINEITYSITFGELEKRGVLIRPIFESFPVTNFDWNSEQIEQLSSSILERSTDDFTKTLILAPRIDKVRIIYDALLERIQEYEDHPLSQDDIGYILGADNSHGLSNSEFISLFKDKPRAIYVSSQVLLEGFNDPGVNTVIITYPSNSLIQLMQAVGRCVRYKVNKRKAYVLQARNDDLAYYFDQRWLYQEISDELRPELSDIYYSSHEELIDNISHQLAVHNVSQTIRERILSQLSEFSLGHICRLVLTGLPYFEAKEDFNSKAAWGAILEDESNSEKFRWIFNDFCLRGASTSNPDGFLSKYSRKFGIRKSTEEASEWRCFFDLLTAMFQAKKELDGEKVVHSSHRPYKENGATTWLKYITFNYLAKSDESLLAFLEDCYNAQEILSKTNDKEWHSVLRVRLPMGGFEAFLLRKKDFEELFDLISTLKAVLKDIPRHSAFSTYEFEIAKIQSSLPLPLYVVRRLEYFLEDFDSYIYML